MHVSENGFHVLMTPEQIVRSMEEAGFPAEDVALIRKQLEEEQQALSREEDS